MLIIFLFEAWILSLQSNFNFYINVHSKAVDSIKGYKTKMAGSKNGGEWGVHFQLGERKDNTKGGAFKKTMRHSWSKPGNIIK